MDPTTGSHRLVGTLTVEEQLLEINGSVWDSDRNLRFGPPKTKSSRRTITLNPATTAMLEAHINKYKPGEKGLVFTGPRGGPINPSNFRSRVWNPTVEKVVGRRVRFHDFRVSSVGWLREAGLDLRTIADRLGHSDISVTANVYSRFSEDLDEAAAKGIGERLGVYTVSTENESGVKPQVRPTRERSLVQVQ